MRPQNQALIVIDVQNDFCPNGALAVTGGDEIVTGINALMDDFASVILTQDWHPAGHSSFASSHDADPFTTYDAPYGPQVLWPDHCIQGTKGAAFHKDLRTHGDLIIRKGYTPAIDSYSAFYENDKVTPTGLEGYLRTRGIDSVTIVGLALDYCVNFSAQDAAKLGFKTTVITDLCRAIDAGTEATARAEMLALGVLVA
ncbi:MULTISPECIES: bifunctional nicotinamidase/pyrazinamidase [Pacificibacter]|uniref:bifunctional nicotinamidase/pyrazinamidase n=1 Tax=Pacificibacter TaxID=1042323 RepID=UPI001C082B49|nr:MULTISPECIES: bifunctional nicotinamidase/pyrazinamidase [Pacificibacter]MBU2937199.1 bifunctional nicotinamidase/pyrazinamidase [Pacificibacter marinus]MDO6615194.1 bifunctional nicotinamidase/pyrazinamidase [Pacificibacter sp. 1_MG-2023]